jgi:replicative DNA helicase
MHKEIYDEQAEISILGSIFLDNEAITRISQIVDVQDFYKKSHREIFSVMVYMRTRDIPLDLVTVPDELRKRQQLENVGGNEYLAKIVDIVPTAHNVAHYCRIVKEKAAHREVVAAATEMIMKIYNGVNAVAEMQILKQKLDNILEYCQFQNSEQKGVDTREAVSEPRHEVKQDSEFGRPAPWGSGPN